VLLDTLRATDQGGVTAVDPGADAAQLAGRAKGQRDQRRSVLKEATIATAISVGAGGTAAWLTFGNRTKSVPTVVGMPPIPELRSDEYMKGLPVWEVREPF
jgi:hypothetical protein